MGIQICFQINSTIRPSTKALINNRMLRNKKAKNAKREGEKVRIREPLGLKDL